MKRKIVSLLLAFCLLASLMIPAYAGDTADVVQQIINYTKEYGNYNAILATFRVDLPETTAEGMGFYGWDYDIGEHELAFFAEDQDGDHAQGYYLHLDATTGELKSPPITGKLYDWSTDDYLDIDITVSELSPADLTSADSLSFSINAEAGAIPHIRQMAVTLLNTGLKHWNEMLQEKLGMTLGNLGFTAYAGPGEPTCDHPADARETERVYPTCTEDGYVRTTCRVCGALVSEQVLPAAGHIGETMEAIEPSCTEPGLGEGSYCLACGAILVVPEEIPALGHAWDDGVVTVEPTETTEGLKLLTCTRCEVTCTVTIPVLGHEHSYEAIVTEPTCTEDGYTTHVCSCGDSYVDSVVPALGHVAETTEALEASCTQPGMSEGSYCTACGEILVAPEEIPALGHAWDDGVVTVEPTNETEGVMTYTCTRCGDTRTEAIPVLGHVHVYEEINTEPTCTTDGYTTHVCSCGDSYVDSIIPAMGHELFSHEITPTFTADGMHSEVCIYCGQSFNQLLPKVDQPFTDLQAGSYYYDAVAWALYRNVTNGTSDTTFAPDKTCNRGQIVTFLWRAMGCPEPTTTVHPFTDIQEGEYYYDAVLWAVENGITNGTSDTTFSPNAPCTRGQVCTFLWRALGSVDPYLTSYHFTDIQAGEFYYKPVLWAVGTGVTNGTSDTTFSPYAPCTRAQVVTFLCRALNQQG